MEGRVSSTCGVPHRRALSYRRRGCASWTASSRGKPCPYSRWTVGSTRWRMDVMIYAHVQNSALNISLIQRAINPGRSRPPRARRANKTLRLSTRPTQLSASSLSQRAGAPDRVWRARASSCAARARPARAALRRAREFDAGAALIAPVRMRHSRAKVLPLDTE